MNEKIEEEKSIVTEDTQKERENKKGIFISFRCVQCATCYMLGCLVLFILVL